MDVTVQDNKSVMTVTAFKSTKEFAALTPAQRIFALSYLEHGDGREAIKAAYPLTRKRPEAYVSQLLGKTLSAPNIRAALSRYFGWDDRTKFLADLDAQIHRAKKGSGNLVSLMALKAKLLGLVSSDLDCGIIANPADARHEARTPADPMPAARGDYQDTDPMSRRIFGH